MANSYPLYSTRCAVTHYLNLKFYIAHGLKLKKIHRVIQFQQSGWQQPYIAKNTNFRAAAKSEMEKEFLKLRVFTDAKPVPRRNPERTAWNSQFQRDALLVWFFLSSGLFLDSALCLMNWALISFYYNALQVERTPQHEGLEFGGAPC